MYYALHSVLCVLDICLKKFLKFSAWPFADKKSRDPQLNRNNIAL